MFRQPYLLYQVFIDRWKKRTNQDEENFIDDNDTDTLFSDTAENSDEKTKKSKKKKNSNQCQDKKEVFQLISCLFVVVPIGSIVEFLDQT